MQETTNAKNLKSEFDFTQLHSICYQKDDPNYHEHLETYRYDQAFDAVWDAYVNISPEKAWSGKMIHFHRMYTRRTQEEVFPGQVYHGSMGQGQVLILNLHVFNGLVKLQVGHEVMEIDREKKLIRICYLENSKSEGSQFIRFKAMPEGKTEVVHKTLYRSGSWFRDKIIYPYFHTKAINEFHGNVRKWLLTK
ncbi:hypothetical protein PBT90_15650 [Algoriphagus halophytocola]|uniref:DUF1990 domain-containing protein n=1 Tax=Algoriphagus halophytocola TaxID=2991499 RepID=A0ABY6MBL6_9BACT|nr:MULTISPECIES: hypothetical protein [unclassified Algoriphagus]UZD21006.1 hypothetical protein OM944_09985 [Algoriphagus sp. TR-M5]WBL42172.1 hypothetical protein PBT90_15650 [Algoriphagus sp. TR-M9]